MKNYAFLFILFAIGLTSCSLGDDDAEFFLQVLPIESVEVPEQFIQGETYEIFVTYNKPSSCHVFNNIVFDIDGHERTVAIVNTVYSDRDCIEEIEEKTVSFDLTISGNETYLFKFYTGHDIQGSDQYHLVEVPVVDGRQHSKR